MSKTEYEPILKKLRERRQKLEAELSQVMAGIRAIKETYNLPIENGEARDIFVNDVVEAFAQTTESQATSINEPRPDEYFGLTITEAAKKYLKKLGHAAHVEDILKEITAGGVEIQGNQAINLYTPLIRATHFFVRVKPKTFGLREFYPNLPKKKKDKPKTKRPLGRPRKHPKTEKGNKK